MAKLPNLSGANHSYLGRFRKKKFVKEGHNTFEGEQSIFMDDKKVREAQAIQELVSGDDLVKDPFEDAAKKLEQRQDTLDRRLSQQPVDRSSTEEKQSQRQQEQKETARRSRQGAL